MQTKKLHGIDSDAKKKLVYVGPLEGFEAIRSQCPTDWRLFNAPATPEALSVELKDAIALVDASMRVRIDDSILGENASLRFISTATTGSDHIDMQAIVKKGIVVRTLKEDSEFLKEITPAAELTWALVLAVARQIPKAAEHVIGNRWVREEFPGIMLNQKTLGIVGCGRIGSWVARYGEAFGMQVVGYDPYREEWPALIQKESLEKVVASSDVLTIHVHLTPETRKILSKSLLDTVKPGAIIVNTSRSGVIDEGALLAGLKSGRLGGVGLDVLEGEPDIVSNALVDYARSHRNLIITPHCGGYSPDAVKLVCRRAAEKIFLLEK